MKSEMKPITESQKKVIEEFVRISEDMTYSLKDITQINCYINMGKIYLPSVESANYMVQKFFEAHRKVDEVMKEIMKQDEVGTN